MANKEITKKKGKTTKKSKSKTTQKDFEKKVIDLAKQGLTSEKIGEKLRKQGIHPKEYKKKISEILKEKELYINPDLKNIEKKLEGLNKHYNNNLQDKKAKKEKDRIFSQLRKLKKYFQK